MSYQIVNDDNYYYLIRNKDNRLLNVRYKTYEKAINASLNYMGFKINNNNNNNNMNIY